MESKFIVTGGAGLIGSNVVKELNALGSENILIVDHLGMSEKWKNLSGLRFKDYMEKDTFLSRINSHILEGYTHLIHLGACSSTTEADCTYLIQNNFEYTKQLCLAALSRNIRFLYASSAATYGSGKQGYSDTSDLFSLRPLNMYGYSKQLFDMYAFSHKLLDKITGLKYFNIFGYGEFHKGDMRSVVLKGYEQVKATSKLKLFKSYLPDYKDGEQKRDFLYVKDAVNITLHLLSGNHFGLYNVGSGVTNTWNQLAEALFTSLGKKVNIDYIEMPESLKAKYQYYTCADISKLNATDYKGGFTPLKEAIKEYVALLE
jgi:ADP-L-glycero-D-manno-heptose 6-epimerase